MSGRNSLHTFILLDFNIVPLVCADGVRQEYEEGDFMLNVTPNFAYIDPGTGSLIIQVLVASLLGGLFTLKIYWKRVKAFFSRIRNKND